MSYHNLRERMDRVSRAVAVRALDGIGVCNVDCVHIDDLREDLAINVEDGIIDESDLILYEWETT